MEGEPYWRWMGRRTQWVFRTLVLGVVACGGSSQPANSDADTPEPKGVEPVPEGVQHDECTAALQRAVDRVLAVVHASRMCTVDSDCRSIEIASRCFDACMHAVSTSGVDAVKRALASAERDECRLFAEQSCTLTRPACDPPAEPTCREGNCE